MILALRVNVSVCSLNRTYDLDTLEALAAETPGCVACGQAAARKCSRCKASYCGRYSAGNNDQNITAQVMVTTYLFKYCQLHTEKGEKNVSLSIP
jgi:hypothetical protein